MKCYQCVVQATGEQIMANNFAPNEAIYTINGQSVCGITDHINAVVAEPGATNIIIGRRNPLDEETKQRLNITSSKDRP